MQHPANVGQLNDEGVADDRRACRRYPAQGPALVAIRWRHYAAELVDISAQGFGIRTERHLVVSPGDAVRLKTTEGWLSMRVAYLWQQPKGTQLGLIRCEDAAVRWCCRSSDLPPLRRLLPQRSCSWLLGGAIAAGTVWLAQSSDRWGAWLTPKASRATFPRVQHSTNRDRGTRTQDYPRDRRGVGSLAERPIASPRSPLHAGLFLSRPVVEYLDLTSSQQQQIEQIVRDCQADVLGVGVDRQAAGALIVGAYQQAFRQLTATQQARWSQYREARDHGDR